MKKIIRGTLAAVLSLSMICATAFAENKVDLSQFAVTDGSDAAQNNFIEAPVPLESRISLPSGMRAVFIAPDKDFSAEEPDFDGLLSNISELSMNAVVISSATEDADFYDVELGEPDVLNAAIDAAHSANMGAYITLDVNSLLSKVAGQGGGLKDGFSAAAHKFAMKYGCEGILLTDYYTEDTPEMYEEYLRSGSGIGYENWLYETNRYVMRSLSEIIHKTSNSMAVGIIIEDMWANSSDNPDGSDTSDAVQALYDGHSDTKTYIENSYADFILVKAFGSTSDSDLNFEKVVSWWNELAEENGIKTYICHMNERVGSYSGWNVDQLLQQLTIMKSMGGSVSGSVFNSLSSLNDDPLSSTEALKKYFADEINTETIFEELKMTSPSSLSFVTYDPTVKFMGTFDQNFDVYFDGNKITLNEVGNFFIQKDLSIGMNYYTIEHKGKKYNYSIERKVDVLKSAYSMGDITVEGGTRLSFTATAYSGSSVSVTVGGKTVALTEKGSSELVDVNGTYSEFVGYYTVADGIIGQEQYLGNITYYASYSGYEETMWGGSVTIAAKPEPPQSPSIIEQPDDSQFSVGTGEVVGRIEPYYTEDDWVTYVKVTNNYTDVLDPMTTGYIPSPEFSQMPAGTLDYYKSSSDNCIITTSGKRYRREYVSTFDDTGLGYNALYVNSIGDSSGTSYINISLDHKSSFNINTSQVYVNGFDGPFGVTNFNAMYVYVTFDNVTSVTALPDFNSCTLFSAGEWQTVMADGIPKFRLKLTLRQQGIFSGGDAYYNSNGDLVLSFPIPTASLYGKTIVISPGHGVDVDGFDPGGVGQVTEQEINLAVSKKLAEELEAMGATVVRLKTESTYIHDRDRPRVAREYGADMYLEIHCNSVLDEGPHGCEVYYFTPWSQPLAKAINNNLVSFWDSAYGDGTISNRGDKYSYYWYTLEQGFPSVLVEMGFVSNTRECLLMAKSANQTKMAKAIAQGVYEYFARSGL